MNSDKSLEEEGQRIMDSEAEFRENESRRAHELSMTKVTRDGLGFGEVVALVVLTSLASVIVSSCLTTSIVEQSARIDCLEGK